MSDILDMVDAVILPDELNIIISRATEVKRMRTVSELEEGDVVRLSEMCSPTLYNAYKNTDLVIDSIDRNGLYHINVGATEGYFVREKLLFIKKGKG